jgi:hypothetical protein
LDNLEQDALNAFAEAIAEGLTEDPNRRMLLTEAIRVLNRPRATAPEQVETNDRHRYYTQIDPHEVIWDFYVVKVYADRIRFMGDGTCHVHNNRTNETTILPFDVATAFRAYLAEIGCGVEDRTKAHDPRPQT